MKVGIPVLKCSLNPSQQKNKRTGKKAKTCSVSAAWNEMNDNRYGRDPTIEKELTFQNVWMIGHSDDDIEKIVQKEIEAINEMRKEANKRALRSDCVSVIEIVEKPNIEMMGKMNYEEKKEFLSQSHEVMKKLIEEWNPEWKWLASVQHHDEFGGVSAHTHSLIMPITFDENGIKTLNAKKEVGIKFFTYINKNYPKMMRSMGYEMIEDCVTYDQLSEEEKMERRLHPKEHGIDAYQFKQKKLKEMEEKMDAITLKNNQMEKKLEEKVIEYTEAPNLKSYKLIQKENEQMKLEISHKNSIIERLEKEYENVSGKLEELKMKLIDISKSLGRRLMTVLGIEMNEIMVKNEMPIPDVINELKGIDEELKEINPKDCRIVPERKETGKFKIMIKKQNGEYELLKDGFESRLEAEKFIQSMKKMHIQIDEKIQLKHK